MDWIGFGSRRESSPTQNATGKLRRESSSAENVSGKLFRAISSDSISNSPPSSNSSKNKDVSPSSSKAKISKSPATEDWKDEFEKMQQIIFDLEMRNKDLEVKLSEERAMSTMLLEKLNNES